MKCIAQKNNDNLDPQNEKDEVADILLHLSENGEKSGLNDVCPMPKDLKEHTTNEFYDVAIKLNKKNHTTERSLCITICETSTYILAMLLRPNR